MTDSLLEEVVRTRNIKALCRFMFPGYAPAQRLTPSQEKIVKMIAYGMTRRATINAMTRYGKSACVAMGVALYIWLHQNKKVAIIAPLEEQASIIRNYIAEIIVNCPRLAALVDIDHEHSVERLRKEASRRRWTFSNGCELRMISAHGEAYRLMGFGADLIILDEAALIGLEAYAKIVRMLGDDPEKAILIELSNPWNRDGKYYEHYVSGRFEVIQIGYEVAIAEGRTTQAFIDEMKNELGGEDSTEFTVLYKSTFPDESDDGLYKFSWVQQATNKKLEPKQNWVISCDPADQGRDFTVIMEGPSGPEGYKVQDIFSEAKSEPMKIAERIADKAARALAEGRIGSNGFVFINIDCIGIGSGVVNRVRQLLQNNHKVRVNACHYGESPKTGMESIDNQPTSSKARFTNKKAEMFFRNAELMRDGLISIPNHPKLRSELLKMKKERTIGEKWRIVDPEDKSPDFADALNYFTWKMQENTAFFWA